MTTSFLAIRGRCAASFLFSALTGFTAAPSPTPPLLEAVRTGDAAAWQSLLTARPDVNARDRAGNTALHLAALNHDLAAVNALLAAGAEPDARNTAEATPLLYGAGHPGIVRALLARGANPNAASKLRNTPLMAAVAHADSFEAARRLLEAGADLHAKKSRDTEVVLERAVMAGDRRTIDLLLERGAAKDTKSASYALTSAAFRGDLPVVELLLTHGADPNQAEDFAGHALNFALLGEHLEVARFLLGKGADPNVRSIEGHGTPPILFAAYNQRGDPSLARALLARGAEVNARNAQGATALGYALRSGHTPLVEYLRAVGATAAEPARIKRVPERPVPPSPGARAALIRERLPATLKLLQRSSDAFLENGFVQKENCTSCHGQDLPAVAYDLARRRGLPVDEISFGRQLSAQTSRWLERSEAARQMTPPLPGSPTTIGYGLFAWRAAGYPADEVTDAMVRYLVRSQRSDGAWTQPIRRPPMEDGTFVATGWATVALRDFAPAGLKQAVAESQVRSARWLEAQTPSTHNEAVQQLLGLHWSGVPRAELAEFTRRLVAAQRADGGWSQLAGLESDAWATGSALYALHEAGGLKTDEPVYQRGISFLLRTQFEDGSWWVRSRSWPFQPHFNGQFPHGKDQWISQGGTAWAAIALLLTLEPVKPTPPIPTPRELIASYAKSAAAQRRKTEGPAPATAASATVNFARDIQPLLARSCIDCHGGQKPRGGFSMASRESLLQGGQSGEPSIAPGYAEDSPLIHYVSGKVEDLEMPPLDRRDEYPALQPAEIDLLRAWIDSGAPWEPATAATSTAAAANPSP